MPSTALHAVHRSACRPPLCMPSTALHAVHRAHQQPAQPPVSVYLRVGVLAFGASRCRILTGLSQHEFCGHGYRLKDEITFEDLTARTSTTRADAPGTTGSPRPCSLTGSSQWAEPCKSADHSLPAATLTILV